MTAPTPGLDTSDNIPAEGPRTSATGAEAIRRILEEAPLVDQLRVDVVTVDQNHHSSFPAPKPETVLAAIMAPARRPAWAQVPCDS